MRMAGPQKYELVLRHRAHPRMGTLVVDEGLDASDGVEGLAWRHEEATSSCALRLPSATAALPIARLSFVHRSFLSPDRHDAPIWGGDDGVRQGGE